MSNWPTAEHEVEDGDEIVIVTFEYCCWTFCAWPELMRLLRIRDFPRCNCCGGEDE